MIVRPFSFPFSPKNLKQNKLTHNHSTMSTIIATLRTHQHLKYKGNPKTALENSSNSCSQCLAERGSWEPVQAKFLLQKPTSKHYRIAVEICLWFRWALDTPNKPKSQPEMPQHRSNKLTKISHKIPLKCLLIKVKVLHPLINTQVTYLNKNHAINCSRNGTKT